VLKDGCVARADRLLPGLFTRAAFFGEGRLLDRSERDKDHLEAFDLEPMMPTKIEITPLISKSGLVFRFSDADIDQVESLGMDVLPTLRGGILNAAKFGVWRFIMRTTELVAVAPSSKASMVACATSS
jgi:hypothetical protein